MRQLWSWRVATTCYHDSRRAPVVDTQTNGLPTDMTVTDPNRLPSSHIDIGGLALPRSELAAVLPDIERFEAHLTDALAVDSHMSNGDGSVPSYVQKWPEERLANVIATLKELGSLRDQLGQQKIGPASSPDNAADSTDKLN